MDWVKIYTKKMGSNSNIYRIVLGASLACILVVLIYKLSSKSAIDTAQLGSPSDGQVASLAAPFPKSPVPVTPAATPEDFLNLVQLNNESSAIQALEALKTIKDAQARLIVENAILNLPPGGKRARMLEMLMATTDKDSVWSILTKLVVPYNREDISGMLNGFGKTSATAQQMVNLVEETKLTGEIKGIILAEAGRRLLAEGKPFGELLAQVKTTFANQSIGLLQAIIGLHARSNPNDVMTAIEEGAIPAEASLAPILNTWGMEHADDVKTRLFDFSIKTQNADLIHSFIGGWLLQDSREASAWVATLPKGEQRKAGALAVYNFLRQHKDDTAAAAWQKEL